MADDLSVQFGASIQGLLEGVDRTKKAIESVKDSTDRVAEGATHLLEALGVAFSIEGIVQFIEKMADLGLQTERTMAMLGLSAQETVELGGMAKLTGTSVEGLSLSLERMALNVQKSARDAFNPAAQGLQVLGLRAKDLIGIPTSEYIDKLHDAVAKFNPSMNLTAAVMAVGGRGIAQIIPLLQTSGEKWDEMRERIRAAQDGLAAAVPGMADSHERLTLLGLSVQSLGARIFTVLKPALDGAVQWLTTFVQKLDSKTIREYATALTDTLGGALIGMISLFSNLGTTIDDAVSKMKTLLLGAAIGGALGLITGPGAVGGALLGAGIAGAWKMFTDQSNEGASKAQADIDKQSTALVDRIKAMMAAVKLALGSATGAGEGATGHGGGDKANAGAMNLAGKDALEAAMASIDSQIKVIQQGLERAKILYEADASNFRITQSEKFALIMEDVRRTEAAEIAKYQSELTWGGLTLKQRQEIENKIVELRERTNTELTKLSAQQFAAERSVVSGYVGSIETSWNSGLRGMLQGTMSFAQAAKNVLLDFTMYAIEQIEKKFVFEKLTTALTTAMHAESEAAKTAATDAGVAERAATEDAGFLASAGKYIADAMAFIGAQVAKVFAAMVAFLAPIFGPAAPAAALGLAAGVSAAAIAMIKKFDVGTDMVTRSGIAMVHEGEAIVPAQSNGPFTGGGAGGGGGAPLSVTFNHYGNLTKQQVRDYAYQLAKEMKDLMAHNPSLRPAH